MAVTALDERALEGFQQHLSSCRCEGPIGSRKKRGNGSALFLRYLRRCGVVPEQEDDALRLPALVQAFREWVIRHRGVTESTLRHYADLVVTLLNELGEELELFPSSAAS